MTEPRASFLRLFLRVLWYALLLAVSYFVLAAHLGETFVYQVF